MDPVLHGVDPFDLDGDLCVVGFLGGMIDSPFILRCWPHPRNLLDPATSAQGQDGKTLPQERRYFRRINGVETVINPEGDITISTTFANSKLNHSKDPVKGRVARDEDADVGGSIKAYVKPSQVLRIDFNEQVEGIGVFEAWDKSLPQTNPPKVNPTAPSDFPQTFIEVDSGNYVSRVPDNNDIYAGKDIRSESAENTRITVGTDYVVDVSGTGAIRVDGTLDLSSDSVLTLDGSQIMHGANASTSEPVILGQKMQDWMVSFTVDSPFGPLPATIAYAQTLVARTGSSKNFVE